MKVNKKLIEVALPLEAINIASAREKSIRFGHPSTLHLWWARRPLAAARAVIFAQMVDDPSAYVDTLLGDPATRRAAQRELKKRQEIWEQRKAAFEAATGSEAVAVLEPGAKPELEECAADIERERLFRIIEELVKWENTTNETVLERARAEIWQSWRRTCAANADHPRAKELFNRNKLPAFHDPFAGGGALPLEAQRLGLESYATDLNPVAVLINKAMIEIPPKFAGRPPVNPEAHSKKDLLGRQWEGAEGLAEDVRYYGQWMRTEAEERIGHLYPKIEITTEMAKLRPDLKALIGKKITVIACLWARTVKSPNPAFANVDVPLVSTFMLSTRPGKETYIEPVIENAGYRFLVKVGKPKNEEAASNGTKLSRANFSCLMSGSPISGDYIKNEGTAGRIGTRLLAVVAEGQRKRVYLSPLKEIQEAADQAKPSWSPDVLISGSTQYLGVKPYGIERFSQLFTNRQLVALTTFSDLVREAREIVKRDSQAKFQSVDSAGLASGGTGAAAYADAVATYLAMAIDKASDYNSSLVLWSPTRDQVKTTFSRQALQMAWDFAETNVFAGAAGDIATSIEGICRALASFGFGPQGIASNADAQSQTVSSDKVISTDPPYYDNVPYSDLSDFFYVWLRRSLRSVFVELFATVATPKTEELVAFAYRHDGKIGAEAFFLSGMTEAMHRIAEQAHPAFPVTIYYAFKQAESDSSEGTASTGWETFLEALIRAGFVATGTWPMRTERESRSRGLDSNALASSIIIVCNRRAQDAATATRRQFLTSLKAELPEALAHLQHGNIAPVDLAQASIGPGMAVYSRYAKVVDAEGKALTVREALALINQTLDEVLAEQEGDFDPDSRWAVAWFEQMGACFGKSGTAISVIRGQGFQ